jgi:hypothetical protein
MLTLQRNTHHVNGESVHVLEVWRQEQEDSAETVLILVIPLEDENEKVRVEI